MIAWMQKNNKYLVWTIWVATVTFIGAGFVGWGTYQLGSKADSVAKVGETEISRQRFNTVYANLYEQYKQMFKGNFDDAQAKRLGLVQQTFAQLQTQAYLINLSKEFGIVVSDEEVAQKLFSISAFENNGTFDRSVYENYLKATRQSAKTFESALRDEIAVEKTLSLLDIPPYPFEIETIGAALSLKDTLLYKVLTPDDVNITVDNDALKTFWQERKERYLTPQTYTLSIVWTATDDADVSEEEIKRHYAQNSFEYVDANGKTLEFEDVKDIVERDLKVKKSKKKAQKDYIAFKKQKRQADENVTLPLYDAKLTPRVWEALRQAETGDILKPKVVGAYYATIKIESKTPSKPMDFETARPQVLKEYRAHLKAQALDRLAREVSKAIRAHDPKRAEGVSLDNPAPLSPLNRQESLQFLQKLFTSKEEKGIISVSDKSVVYEVVSQALESNLGEAVKEASDRIKKETFRRNLIKYLRTKYPTEVYMEGLER